MSGVPDKAEAFRPAVAADVGAINRIYNHYVRTSDCTFDTEPVSDADRDTWLADRDRRHPVLVVETAGQILGWGALSRFGVRAAYDTTVEASLYLDPKHCGRGLGGRMMQALLVAASELDHHVVVSRVVGGQEPSIRLHERLGFKRVGRLEQVGRKFDRWLDVIYFQRTVGEAEGISGEGA